MLMSRISSLEPPYLVLENVPNIPELQELQELPNIPYSEAEPQELLDISEFGFPQSRTRRWFYPPSGSSGSMCMHCMHTYRRTFFSRVFDLFAFFLFLCKCFFCRGPLVRRWSGHSLYVFLALSIKPLENCYEKRLGGRAFGPEMVRTS